MSPSTAQHLSVTTKMQATEPAKLIFFSFFFFGLFLLQWDRMYEDSPSTSFKASEEV